MDIGFTKNQGRGTGVEDLLRKGDVTKLLSKDEIVSNYIQHLIDKDAPLKDLLTIVFLNTLTVETLT